MTADRPAQASGQRDELDASAAEMLELQHTEHPLPGWDVTCWVCRLTPAEAFRLGYRAGVAAATAPDAAPAVQGASKPPANSAPSDELREDLAAWFAGGHEVCSIDYEHADAVLALPAVRRLLDAQEAVQRVRELAEEWPRVHANCGCSPGHLIRELGWALGDGAR